MKTPVLIATPLRSWRSPQESLSPALRQLLVDLAKVESDFTFDFTCYAGGNVARGRNKILAYFLRASYRYILFIDDDIEPTVEDVLRLLSHREYIVGGLYTTREENARLVLNPFNQSTEDERGLMPVGELGCGFKCYHRKVFEFLIKREPALAYVSDEDACPEWGFFNMGVMEVDGRRRWLSEDYWFDQLCRKHHVVVFADMHTRVMHRDISGKAYPVNGWPDVPRPRVKPTPPPMAEDFPPAEIGGQIAVVVQSWEGDRAEAEKLANEIRASNLKVEVWEIQSPRGLPYPEGPNATAIGIMHMPWAAWVKAVLLLEADCVPLAADWLEQLSDEWDRAEAVGKLVMGSWRPECGDVGHINGCLMFSPKLKEVIDFHPVPKETAWDVHYAKLFAPYWCRTGLIANRYKEICVTEEQLLTPECGSRSPVMVHGVKDDSARKIAQKLLQRDTSSLHQLV